MVARVCMTQPDREGVSVSTDPLDLKHLSRCDLKILLGEVIERSLAIEQRLASMVARIGGI